jgi:hypothetical protein
MAHAIVMPRLTDSMEEGTVADWHKRPGEEAARGEVLVCTAPTGPLPGGAARRLQVPLRLAL